MNSNCTAILPNITDAINFIHDDVSRIHSGAKSFGILVNPTKSKYFIISNRFPHATFENVYIPYYVVNIKLT